MNNKNLRHFTIENSKDNGAKGGRKSGEVRRKKKDVQTRLKDALEIAIANPELKQKLEESGFTDPTWADKIVFDMLMNTSNPNMVKLIMEYSGEKDAASDNSAGLNSLIESLRRPPICDKN